MFGKLKLALPLVLLGALSVIAIWDYAPQPTRLTFLAVGQGDCAVFQHQGTTILIDVGPKTPWLDAGKRIVVPRLRELGVDQVDLIYLTHPDADHIGGLESVARAYPRATVAASAAFRNHKDLREALDRSKLKVIWLDSDKDAKVGEFTIDVHCPLWTPALSDNEGSLFIRISNGISSAVLTGDAGYDAESRVALGVDWSAQVMTAGHHGSKTSSSQPWIQELRPTWAVVSAGRNNRYNHPHPSVLTRLRQNKIQVARTDQEGDITFIPTSQGFQRAR